MHFVRGNSLFCLIVLSSAIAVAQNIVGNPTGSQTIAQPTNTTLNVNSLENVLYADQFGSIQSAINKAPLGGTVIVPPGWFETLSTANGDCPLTINRSVVLRFAGSATINQGSCQIVVSAGANQVSIVSDFPLNSNTGTYPVVFAGYTGNGPALQIGSTSADTMNFYMKGIHVDAPGILSNGSIIMLSRAIQFWLDGVGVSYNGTNTNIAGILIDGTKNFSGIGRIDFPIISIGVASNGGSTGSVGIRAQNITTHTLVTGGQIEMTPSTAGSNTVCLDVNGGSLTASELTLYSPNCESANTALTIEGNAHVVGDLRTDSGVTTLANFDSATASNKIRFVDDIFGTVVDKGANNSVEFPYSDQIHSDIWQIMANPSAWAVSYIPTGKDPFYANPANTFVSALTGAVIFNQGSGNGVLFYNGGTTQVASIDGAGNAHFNGNLSVQGTKSFRIDDPLDPKKYLYHAAVESPDMKNMYDGIATLGPKGSAVVQLPAYFQALNRDFRYQLTPIGASASVYVAREIRNNRFVIAGGRPGLKVSWLVTGIRHDTYAKTHPMVVEQEKTAEDRKGSPTTPEKASGKQLFTMGSQ